jgi:hypothetical protein
LTWNATTGEFTCAKPRTTSGVYGPAASSEEYWKLVPGIPLVDPLKPVWNSVRAFHRAQLLAEQ